MNHCRLATPADASAFARWAESNHDIPRADIEAVANAVTLTVVAEVDGEAELYIPFIFSPHRALLTIGYLGFRPGHGRRTKSRALRAMLASAARLRDHLGCEMRVVTKAEYPMGKWALKHGFIQKSDGFYLENKNVQ